MRTITLFDTAVGSSNLGDEIILEAVRREMALVFESGLTLRLATHINNFTGLQMLRHNGKIAFFEQADLKFICGTNLLSQKRFGKVNQQWQLKRSNLPVYKNCILVGVGATTGDTVMEAGAARLYKKVLSGNYIHSVRDDHTLKLVEALGVRAVNTGCPTLWGLTEEHCRSIPKGKAPDCIFSISGYADQKEPEADRELLEILSAAYENKWAWIQTTEDENYLNRFDPEGKIPRIYSLEQFRRLLKPGQVDYVGTRLHGGVFALQTGCRSLVIAIDQRAMGFHETNNLPVLPREEVRNGLEKRLHDGFETRISLPEKEIRLFKEQF